MIISFVLTLALLVLFKKIAFKIDLLDQPGGRKAHKNAVPLIGGIAVFSSFLLLCLAFTPWMTHWMSYLALTILLYVGIIDDAIEVNAKLKFAVHFLVATLLVMDGIVLESMGNILGFGETSFGVFAPLFTICCIVYLINAINMIDGLDGLSGGIGFVIAVFLFSAMMMKGLSPSLEIRFLMGALLAFLIFNYRHPWRERASVFMGDAGTMVLGLVLAWMTIDLSQEPDMAFEPISIAWLLALPIWDAFGMLTSRLRRGKHPFEPDRSHFHHHFIEAGYKADEATPLILLYCIVLCSIGVFWTSFGLPVWALTYLWVAMWILHAQLSYKPEGFIQFLARVRKIGQKPQKIGS